MERAKMKYVIRQILKPDVYINYNQSPGVDRLSWISPYPGLRAKVEESIKLGHISRYYTEDDTAQVDPETGNILTQRSYLNLEGAQSWYDFLSATLTLPNCAILEMWMEQIDDDGTRTKLN
jgi:hypothetical protein